MPRYDDDEDEYDDEPRPKRRSRRANQQQSDGDTQATTGMVVGIICLIAWCLPIVGLPLSIWGIIASIKGMNSSKHGQAIAGIVMSSIGLLLTILNAVAGVLIALNNQQF